MCVWVFVSSSGERENTQIVACLQIAVIKIWILSVCLPQSIAQTPWKQLTWMNILFVWLEMIPKIQFLSSVSHFFVLKMLEKTLQTAFIWAFKTSSVTFSRTEFMSYLVYLRNLLVQQTASHSLVEDTKKASFEYERLMSFLIRFRLEGSLPSGKLLFFFPSYCYTLIS